MTPPPGTATVGGGALTVDGAHATDVGFLRIAQVLKPVLKGLLRPAKSPAAKDAGAPPGPGN